MAEGGGHTGAPPLERRLIALKMDALVHPGTESGRESHLFGSLLERPLMVSSANPNIFLLVTFSN